MRILENCISAWPMPDMQAQIQSLREAFSADINKPFALKPSFPFGSPISRLAPSPPSDTHYSDIQLVPRGSQEPPSHIRFHSNPITPPISAGHEDSKDALASSSLSMMTSEQRSQTLPSHLGEENLAWNPTRLFEYGTKPITDKPPVKRTNANRPRSQWNTAFGTPPSTASVQGSMNAQQSPTMYSAASSTVGSHDISQVHDALQQQRHYQTPPITTPVSQQPSYTAAPNPYVTPSMWQDTVASTYVPNDLKRRWDGAGGPAWVGSNDQQQVKRPR